MVGAVVAGASVDAASVIAVFACCLACGVTAGVVAGSLWDLCLQLRDCVHIANFHA